MRDNRVVRHKQSRDSAFDAASVAGWHRLSQLVIVIHVVYVTKPPISNEVAHHIEEKEVVPMGQSRQS